MNIVKKSIYDISRNYLKGKFTRNLGNVIEYDDKLVCYVQKNKTINEGYARTVPCSGLREEDMELAKMYNLDKPIYYVLDGLDFAKDRVYIFGYDKSNVIVKNCKFNYGLYMSVRGKCKVEDSYIRSFGTLMINANELVLENMDIQNYVSYTSELQIRLGADDKLEIINSKIGRTKENTSVYLSNNHNLIIDSSSIAGDKIECEAQVFESINDSSLVATDKIDLKLGKFDNINVDSPTVILNGEEINYKNNSFTLRQLSDPLSLKRLELVKVLRDVRDRCVQNNLEDVNKYKQELDNRSVIKTLRK